MMRKPLSILLVLCMALSLVPALAFNTNAASYETAIFPAPQLYVTQLAYESYSHGSQNAIDIAPGGNVFAPFTGTVVYRDPDWGFVALQSNDKVYFADGSLDYMTVGFMHDENISDISKGQIINRGQQFYQAGGMGSGNPNAYDDHVHICVWRGKHTPTNSNAHGNMYAFDAFYVNTKKTTVVKKGKMEPGNYMTNGAPSDYSNKWVMIDRDVVEEKPVLKDLRTKYANGDSVLLTCDAVSWANQYMFVSEKWNGSEWKVVYRQPRGTSRECNLNVTEGKYRVYVVAYDTSRWMADGSDYYYVSSDRVTFTVAGDHVCDNAEYVYYWKAHPHYNCYRCSICGKVNEDRSSSNFIESCRECHRPSKPAFVDLQPVYRVGETITFRWNATANTTHYNFWIWKQDDTGTWEDDHGKWKTYEHLFDIESGKTYELPAGEYRVLLTACNKNWWEEDNSDYLHNESEFNYFSVKTACEIDGHVWDKGVITQEPTATAEGVKTFTCTVCGETRTESIPKLDNPFKDVAAGKYYYDAVLWAVNQDPQVTSGYSDGTFRPDQTCTRAQVVTFLWRAKGCPEPTTTVNPFKDVSASAYYYKAVLWAVENHITTGYADGTFRPDGECTRAHVVTFLWRLEGSPAPQSASNPFKDVPAGQFYTNAALWAVENNITTGYADGTFRPETACTRGQIVTFLYRAYN